MLNFLVKRLLGLLPTLVIVAGLVFLFVHLLPGVPARLAAGLMCLTEAKCFFRRLRTSPSVPPWKTLAKNEPPGASTSTAK